MTQIPNNMCAAMYYNNQDIRVEEMSVPQAGAGEVVMKIMSSGICGSNIMEWYRIHKSPLVFGHEVAGEVAAVGSGVTQYKVDGLVKSHAAN